MEIKSSVVQPAAECIGQRKTNQQSEIEQNRNDQSKWQRENRQEKQNQRNRDSGTCFEPITKYLISVSPAPGVDEKEDEAEYVLKEMMAENFPNTSKHINVKIQKAEWSRDIIIEFLKTKENLKILKGAREDVCEIHVHCMWSNCFIHF